MLQDVNDEIPQFRSPSYTAEIRENAVRGTPVTLLGGGVPEVFDHDLGSNGTFQVSRLRQSIATVCCLVSRLLARNSEMEA